MVTHHYLFAFLIIVAAVTVFPGFLVTAKDVLLDSVSASQKSVKDVLLKYATDARTKIIPYYDKAGILYPPDNITMLAIKDSAILEIWAGPSSQPAYIRSYEIQSMSGKSGPKLREGDKQVPEGIYTVEGLNPNSNYHLSIKLNYPNAFDLKHAKKDNRTNPGGNIFIHGKARSIGCLAMGDKAIEELFVLTADVKKENIKVVIAPTDPRDNELVAPVSPSWVAELYRRISGEFANFTAK